MTKFWCRWYAPDHKWRLLRDNVRECQRCGRLEMQVEIPGVITYVIGGWPPVAKVDNIRMRRTWVEAEYRKQPRSTDAVDPVHETITG